MPRSLTLQAIEHREALKKKQLNSKTQQVFMNVMQSYRFMRGLSPIAAVNYAADGHSCKLGENQLMFCCDVELALQAAMKSRYVPLILAVYGLYDGDDIEVEKLADRVFEGGQGRAQNLKHVAAREFQRRGIYPVKNYMHSQRKPPRRDAV